MKSIMAINFKFFELSPKELISIVKDNSKYIDGFEIYIDFFNEYEKQYLINLSYECKINNMYFQVHSDSNYSLDNQIKFIKLLEHISDDLGYKINIVLHSIYDDDKNESIKITQNYLNDLVENIDNDKVIVSLENLNDNLADDRLDYNEILPIGCNNEKIFITYDIGHIIADYGNVTQIIDNMIPLISNVHIHSQNNSYFDGYDHKPIYKNDKNWDKILKGILFLKINKYKGSIVFEYDLFTCRGETIKEKIIDYCTSIDYVSEHFK